MTDVFDDQGNLIAAIPISARQLILLEAGAEVAMIFHSPQLLRHVVGEHNGSFSLYGQPSSRVRTREPEMVKQFADLQAAVCIAKKAEGR